NARIQYGRNVEMAKKQLDAAKTGASNTPPPTSDQPDQAAPPPSNNDVAAAQNAYDQAVADRDSALVPFASHRDAVRDAYQQVKSGAKMSQLRAPISGTVLALNAQPGQEVGADPKIPVATIVDLTKLQV